MGLFVNAKVAGKGNSSYLIQNVLRKQVRRQEPLNVTRRKMKTKKLVKNALKHPELYGPAELAFFRRWLDSKKQAKTAKINKDKKSKDR
jgi:hypothetical protein